jgi:pSer/pThr/pTyr-binding forkhead associated (FHA) protein
MAKLVIVGSRIATREFALNRDRITIGRRADHDLCLPFPEVSADHAEIVTVGADSFLHDLGSTNGTLVNGNRVTKHFLRDHDRIDIAKHELVYLTNDAEILNAGSEGTSAEPATADRSDADEAAVYALAEPGVDSPRATAGDVQRQHVDELLSDLMEMQSGASAAVEIPPDLSLVRNDPVKAAAASASDTSSAVVEILSGPNAGQVASMRKPEFVLGKLGATVAAIRQVDAGYRLVPLDRKAVPLLNGRAIDTEGALLAFGDMIDVAGVKLRFGRAT